MTLPARLTARLLCLAPALAFGVACAVEIQHDLAESEANEIIMLLDTQAGIKAKKAKEEGGREITWLISVPKQDAARAIRTLKENELPRPKTPGFEIFNQGGLIPTATEERAKFLQSISGELSRTLRSVDGVLLARVHVNIPEQNELADIKDKPLPTASVLIKYRNAAPSDKPPSPAPIADRWVKEIVARAVQELKPENVTVVTMPGYLPGASSATADFVDVVGLRMVPESASTFKVIMGLGALLLLGLCSYVVYLSARGLKNSGQGSGVGGQ